MKVEALIFNLIAVFCFVCAIVYGVWSREPIGTTALALSGGLTILIGGFFWFVSRRIDLRPEDRKDAEIADGAGELGFFSPASYWPFTLALAVAAATALETGLTHRDDAKPMCSFESPMLGKMFVTCQASGFFGAGLEDEFKVSEASTRAVSPIARACLSFLR